MQKFSTWMIILLDIMFWLSRVIAAYTEAMAIDFMIKPMDVGLEITMIFVALLAFILLVKRKYLGAVIYVIGYYGYFGFYLVQAVQKMQTAGGMVDDYISVLMSFIGVVLPTLTTIDLLLDKNRQLHPTDKKTDWFYKNKKYDIQKDERADKNNYRTL